MCENCGCGEHSNSTIVGPDTHEHSHAHSHDDDGSCCGRDVSKSCCKDADRKYCCETVDNPPVPSKHQAEKRVIRCAGEDD